jgi:transketolase
MLGTNSEKKATRAAYGETLVELLAEGCDIYAVEADLSGSTTSKKLKEADSTRHLNVGIAEQNMIGVAAGLSLTGKTVFTGSFAIFGTGRAYDQIRNTICYAALDVKIAPTHAGISVGPDGGSHQMIEDVALMRVLPAMRVLVPADYFSAKAAIRIAARTPGPFYVRMGRMAVPQIYDDSTGFELGKARILRFGSDVTIVACGIEVYLALEAAQRLAEKGIEAEVIDAFSLKPLDAATILDSARKTGFVITAEEHSVIGGLGSATAELFAEHPTVLRKPLGRIGVQDRFGTSGNFDELFREYRLDAQAIYDLVVQ